MSVVNFFKIVLDLVHLFSTGLGQVVFFISHTRVSGKIDAGTYYK